MQTIQPTKLSWFWRWGLPVLTVLMLILASQGSRSMVNAFIVSPFGLSENLPTLFLFGGVYYAWRVARLPNAGALRGWMFVFAAALIFFAGEDQNWFQYWMGAEVPEYFLVNNKEQEINLHNMSSWFNQKPRLAVEIWALVGCFLVPMAFWTWPQRATARFIPTVLWPSREVVPAALISILIGLSGRVWKHLSNLLVEPVAFAGEHHDLMEETFPGLRISELQEMTFAYLMFLFALLLYRRLKIQ